jgi:hypothetical protein
LAKKKYDNDEMIRKIREELSLELDKMTTKQREKFFKGAKEVYEGLRKMAKARTTIAS